MSDIVVRVVEEVVRADATDTVALVGHPGPVVSITEDMSIDAENNGTAYNNAGADADVLVMLPPARASLRFGLRVVAGFELAFSPDAGNIILLDDIVIGDAEKLACAGLGAVLDLEAQDDSTWLVINMRGPWAPAEL